MIKAIVLDIEGTTSPIDFVHKVLFPYSFKGMEEFVHLKKNDPEIHNRLQEVAKTILVEEDRKLDESEISNVLKEWISQDRKHPSLKFLQGLIWQEGFQSGSLVGQVYDDVPLALEFWGKQLLRLGIYSSGSVLAQKNLFHFSNHGNLTVFLSFYFDTAIGFKKEKKSYEEISKKLQLDPNQILFLSDVGAELQAAKSAFFNVAQIVRPGTLADQRFDNYKTLLEVDIKRY